MNCDNFLLDLFALVISQLCLQFFFFQNSFDFLIICYMVLFFIMYLIIYYRSTKCHKLKFLQSKQQHV